VLAYARFDLSKALETSKKLPAPPSAGAVDVDALEAAAFLGAKSVRRAGAGSAASPKPKSPEADKDQQEAAAKKKKKRRRRIMPKNYNPDVDPDPERWLPRRERAGYRRTRKERRKGEKFTGAQGTAAGQSDNFDYSAKKASAGPASPASGAVPKGGSSARPQPDQNAPRQQQRKGGGGGQQKKKGNKKNRF